jgi:hypothetical protein
MVAWGCDRSRKNPRPCRWPRVQSAPYEGRQGGALRAEGGRPRPRRTL